MISEQKPRVRFINPPNVLKQKVGGGGIDPKRLEKAQNFIDENKLEFEPYAENYLETINAVIANYKAGKLDDRTAIDDMIRPIMQLKANGGMFKYSLISDIADIVLLFLENIDTLNDEAISVVLVHQKTLQVIIGNKLRGTGGQEGTILARELEKACLRYYKKYKIEAR